MVSGVQQDWLRTKAWDPDHLVLHAFGRLRGAVLAGKEAGVSNLPVRMSAGQQLILVNGIERLRAGATSPDLDRDAENIMRLIARRETRRGRQDGWRALAPAFGIRAGAFLPDEAIGAGRHLPIAKVLAMSPAYWRDPIQAILFAATSYAIEVALRRKRRKPEPLKTEAVLHYFHDAIEYRVIRAMDAAEAPLPASHTLDIGTASMQENRDLLSADLALVAGVRVLGRPMYRIVLVQAKNATPTGRADIGERDDGRQLDTLLSTGMGWYLFYPGFGRTGSFLATVRSAEDVFEDVWGNGVGAAFDLADAYGGGRSPGWDFPSFVSLAMTSGQELSPGRLFPDAESAAEALSSDRKTPLAADIVAFDSTDRLRLRDFIDATAALGYKAQRLSSAPSRRRPRHRPAAIVRGPSADGW